MSHQTLKFVIVKHITPQKDIHWDFMLETGDVLGTWRIDIPPEELGEQIAAAEKIFDHSKKFLTYEGPVNEGKGSVCIAESGTYEVISEDDRRLLLDLKGAIVKGRFGLRKKTENEWELSAVF